MADKLAPTAHPLIIQERSKQLRALSQAKRIAAYKSYIGECVSVLFEEQDIDGYWTGLTDTYIRVSVRSNEDLANKLRTVCIAGILGDKAVGKLAVKSTGSEKCLAVAS